MPKNKGTILVYVFAARRRRMYSRMYPGECRSRLGSRWRSAERGFLDLVVLTLGLGLVVLTGFQSPRPRFTSRARGTSAGLLGLVLTGLGLGLVLTGLGAFGLLAHLVMPDLSTL